jgi:dihydroorotate dehydrogenase (fumarate)
MAGLDSSGTQGVTGIELNVACPNIPGKPVIAYDFEQLEAVLRAVTAHPSFGSKPVGVKLAPYFDMPHFRRAADIINQFSIDYVVCINTIGNALIVDTEAEQPLIAPKGGFGGLGGGYVKQTALANVRQLRMLLKDEIDVVGVGGIFTGADAFDHILCGASAVQVKLLPCTGIAKA